MSNICINTTRLIHVYRLKASCFSSVRSQKEAPAKTQAILLPLWSLLHSLKESQEVDGTTCFVEWTLSAQKTASDVSTLGPASEFTVLVLQLCVRNGAERPDLQPPTAPRNGAFTLTRAAPSEQSERVCAFGLVRNYLY